MSRTRTIFIAAMSIAGLLLGLLTMARAGAGAGPAPAAAGLIALAFLFDLAAMRGMFGLVRLSNGARFGGLISGVVIYLLTLIAANVLRPAAALG